MGQEDGLLGVRADLCTRIDMLAHTLDHVSCAQIAAEVDDIRRIAGLHGMAPVATVAHALEAALARGERGPMVLAWLGMLRETCGCHAIDAATAQTFAAALSVRFTGR